MLFIYASPLGVLTFNLVEFWQTSSTQNPMNDPTLQDYYKLSRDYFTLIAKTRVRLLKEKQNKEKLKIKNYKIWKVDHILSRYHYILFCFMTFKEPINSMSNLHNRLIVCYLSTLMFCSTLFLLLATNLWMRNRKYLFK